MNKRKILAMAMALAMCAILVVGGTLAYFTDADFNKNVMTLGNVEIDQIEQERDANGTLIEFADGHKLAPYTGTVGENGMATEFTEKVTVNGTEYDMFDQDKNAIDKIVTVKNTGSEECYVRTLFAFEIVKNADGTFSYPNVDKEIVLYAKKGLNGKAIPSWAYDFDGQFDLDVKAGDRVTFELDGTWYYVCEHYYDNESKLAPGAITTPSLMQLYLNANMDNEFTEKVGPEYNILVLSQATQTQGFTSAKEALNTAFGCYYELGGEVVKGWFENTESKEISMDK